MNFQKIFSVLLATILVVLISFSFVGVASATKLNVKDHKVIEFVDGKVKFNWDRAKDVYKNLDKKTKRRVFRLYRNGVLLQKFELLKEKKSKKEKPEKEPPVAEEPPVVEPPVVEG